jgi:hypothetical protein
LIGAALLASPSLAAPSDGGRTETEVVDILQPPQPPPPVTRTSSSDPAALDLKSLAIACVKSRSAEVERADATLSDAVEFLVADLCHDQVAAYGRFVRNSQRVDLMRETNPTTIEIASIAMAQMSADQRQKYEAMLQQMQRAQEAQREAWQKATVDPETGDIRGAPEDVGGDDDDEDAPADIMFAGAFRTAAAEAVLAARTARLAASR